MKPRDWTLAILALAVAAMFALILVNWLRTGG